MIGGVKVITHHGTDTGLQITRVAQGFRDGVLAFERKLLRRAGDLKMEFTSEPQQRSPGLLELGEVGGRQKTRDPEGARSGDAAGDAGQPNAPLDITERSHPVL